MPPQLDNSRELYIDYLEVRPDFRRMGIATTLIQHTVERARKGKAYQVRSWTSVDKVEAIQLWKRLGFGLCPATTYPRGEAVQGYFVSLIVL